MNTAWWDVFLLFTIPIGGGIPAGVVLAQKRGLTWVAMSILYFFSDVVLACIFEPLMWFFIHQGKTSPRIAHFNAALKKAMQKTIPHSGLRPAPFTLVMIAFGVDPMTGRATTHAAGHGFWSGWAIAILGDMLSFWLVMASTIWLNNLLGDGTLTTIIIMVMMIFGPGLLKKLRERGAQKSA